MSIVGKTPDVAHVVRTWAAEGATQHGIEHRCTLVAPCVIRRSINVRSACMRRGLIAWPASSFSSYVNGDEETDVRFCRMMHGATTGVKSGGSSLYEVRHHVR